MTTAGIFLAALLFLLVLTLLAIFEISLSQANKMAFRRLYDQASSKSALEIKQVIEERPGNLVDLSVGIQVLLVSMAIILTGYFYSQFGSYFKSMFLACGFMFLVVIIFRQLLPRIIIFRNPTRAILVLLPIYLLFRPLLRFLTIPLSFGLKGLGILNISTEKSERTEEQIEKEIQNFINVGQEEGILKEGENDLIQSVVEFSDIVAGDVMSPRTEMVTIDVKATPEMLKQLITSTKYSRMPVYRDHVENIEGFVYLKDLIDVWDSEVQVKNIESLMRPIHFVPDTKRIAELMAEMQRQSYHMAIIVDEHGGIAGLVTIEDILEEIAGEIHDEDEVVQHLELSKDSNGDYLIPGNTAVEDVEELFGIKLNSDENVTVAGFLNSIFGRVPNKGDRYDYKGVQFEVKDADHRHVKKLLAKEINPSESDKTKFLSRR